jgi:hypothetical protein
MRAGRQGTNVTRGEVNGERRRKFSIRYKLEIGGSLQKVNKKKITIIYTYESIDVVMQSKQ